MEPTTELTVRPPQVATAIRLILISLVLGFLVSVTQAAKLVSGVPLVATLLVAIVFYGLLGVFVSKILPGRNWARIILLVLVLIGLPFAVPTYIGQLRQNVLLGLVGIVIVILQVVGTYLLFTKNSNAWFRTRK